MSGFTPGDLVTPIAVRHPEAHTMRVGGWYRVADTAWDWVHDELDLLIAGQPLNTGITGGWAAKHFRKLNDGADDAELIARIRACKPVRVGEPA